MSNKLQILLSIVIAVVVIGVAYVYLVNPDCPEPDYEAMADMKTKILAIWNDQAYEHVGEIFAEDFKMNHSSLPEPLVGSDAYIEFASNNAIAFPDFELHLSDFHASGDMQFVFWKAKGTNTGDFADGSPATGKEIKIWGLAANKIVDGKIVKGWIVFNQYDMLNQMGMFGDKASMDPLPKEEGAN